MSTDPIQARRDQWRATLAAHDISVSVSDLEIDMNDDAGMWKLVTYRAQLSGASIPPDDTRAPPPDDTQDVAP
jgi:hypothetical protein